MTPKELFKKHTGENAYKINLREFYEAIADHNQQIIKLIDSTITKVDKDVWHSNDEIHEILTELKNKIIKGIEKPSCGTWSYIKPNKPCLFVARYNEQDGSPSLHYAGYDEGILCVSDVEENFVSTMEEYADCQFFIVEYLE